MRRNAVRDSLVGSGLSFGTRARMLEMERDQGCFASLAAICLAEVPPIDPFELVPVDQNPIQATGADQALPKQAQED